MYRSYRGSLEKPEGDSKEAAAPAAPAALQKKVKRMKKLREKSRETTTTTTCRRYGLPRKKRSTRYLLKLLRMRYPFFVVDFEEEEKEKEKEAEETRLPEKEVEKLPALAVKKVNWHLCGKAASGSEKPLPGNCKKHHTDKYTWAMGKDKDPQPIFRRGQEFKVTITFNRPYNKKQDDLILVVVLDEEEDPGKGLMVEFNLDEERKQPFKEGDIWTARIKKMLPEKDALKLAIYIPGNVAVGEWDLKVKTSLRGQPTPYLYEHDTPFIVLFNPWSPQDQVHYTGDVKDLDEYILNSKGAFYCGVSGFIRSRPWFYEQFDVEMLHMCLTLLKKAFEFKISPDMGDPVEVSRALSRIVNCSDDGGLLTGNWSGDYSGGTSPTVWSSSKAIITQYFESGSVKYGQCWVFSHVLTAVCRALGLPCRSVTNFDSAHDTDGSCSIDCYYDKDGKELKHLKKDSIWNFHVWNEVWINRPDIPQFDMNGWHIIDATPQEPSDKKFQCGPAPVKAVKEGMISVGYDTAFVFSEVNADVVIWMVDEGKYTVSSLKKNSVGAKISTKPPDGKPHKKTLAYWNQNSPDMRMDLTDQYKHPEGSTAERDAIKRAVRQGKRGSLLYAETAGLEVNFAEEPQTELGQDLTVTALVKNISKEDKEVELLMSARTSSYFNNSEYDKDLCKENLGKRTIKAGVEEKMQITVPVEAYSESCDEDMIVYAYARAMDVKKKMPYSAQKPFTLGIPDIEIKAPEKAKPKEVFMVEVTFTNPLKCPLTSCLLTMKGDLYQKEDDPNLFETFMYANYIDHRDLKAQEKVTMAFQMYLEEAPAKEEDEEEEDPDDDNEEEEEEETEEPDEERTHTFEFTCRQLPAMTGTFTVQCCKP
ncbi:protein-glutamine gamma-glutamyltransferase Z-like [Babylonia areolata]|uniref:protein-glutamine gamma-glutamyltransferase Z-like n=1 Tax=Babylonia areolata TaxID=304850 RepID=UPI003FD36F0D